jgi:lipopolysaccharide export system protein LptA
MTNRFWLYAMILALAAPGSASAQSPRAGAAALPAPAVPAAPAPSFLQNENQDQPIQIDADTLEVHDKEKMATFSGEVTVVQGDTTIKCPKLVVFYGPEPGSHPANAAQGKRQQQPQSQQQQQAGTMPTRSQDIRKIEARDGVTVTSKDQNASGDLGVYDLKKKTITLTGNVVVSQGKNVLHGDRVVVDTTTGNAHFDTGGTPRPNSRVRALILPSKNENGAGPSGPSNIMPIGPPKAN